MLKLRYIGRGMHLEFCHPEYRTPIVTSAFRKSGNASIEITKNITRPAIRQALPSRRPPTLPRAQHADAAELSQSLRKRRQA